MNRLAKKFYRTRDHVRQNVYTTFPRRNRNAEIRLILTLVVRDEIDIIEKNLIHHSNNGVDFMIVTDHMSTDGTRELLERYEAEGKIHLIRKDTQTFHQAQWVNEMGELAFNKFGADYVIHSDADEFWCAHEGSIKQTLLQHPQVDVLSVRCWQCLLDSNKLDRAFPENVGFIRNALDLERKDRRVFPRKFDDTFCKVITKNTQPMPMVMRGNHSVENAYRYRNYRHEGIVLLHFPMRTLDQITNSFKNHATSTPDEFDEQKVNAYFEAFHEKQGVMKITDEYCTSEAEAEACIDAGYVVRCDEWLLSRYVPELIDSENNDVEIMSIAG